MSGRDPNNDNSRDNGHDQGGRNRNTGQSDSFERGSDANSNGGGGSSSDSSNNSDSSSRGSSSGQDDRSTTSARARSSPTSSGSAGSITPTGDAGTSGNTSENTSGNTSGNTPGNTLVSAPGSTLPPGTLERASGSGIGLGPGQLHPAAVIVPVFVGLALLIFGIGALLVRRGRKKAAAEAGEEHSIGSSGGSARGGDSGSEDVPLGDGGYGDAAAAASVHSGISERAASPHQTYRHQGDRHDDRHGFGYGHEPGHGRAAGSKVQ